MARQRSRLCHTGLRGGPDPQHVRQLERRCRFAFVRRADAPSLRRLSPCLSGSTRKASAKAAPPWSTRVRYWRLMSSATASARLLARSRLAASSTPSFPAAGASSGSTAARKYCRSEEHTYELQSLLRISYAVFRLKKKK